MRTRIEKRHKHSQRTYHIETQRTSVYHCRECCDTMECPTCHHQVSMTNGERIDGCMRCNYTGFCPHCCHLDPGGHA